MSNKAPNFDILIGGVSITDAVRTNLLNINLTESIKNTAKFEFTMGDFEGFDLDPETLKLGNPIKLYLGYGTNIHFVFAGEITKVTPNFSNKDSSTLKVTALDKSYLFKREPFPKIFEGSIYPNLKAVAKSIVENRGLNFVLSPVQNLLDFTLEDDQDVNQKSDTDWQVLKKLASIKNYKLFVRDNTVFMLDTPSLIGRQKVRLVLEHRPDDIDVRAGAVIPLKSFTPSIGAAKQKEKVRLISWKATGGKKAEENLGEISLVEDLLDLVVGIADEIPAEGNSVYTDIKFRTNTIETIRVIGQVKTKEQAKAIVEAELERRAEDLVTGSGIIQGEPLLQFGQRHTFKVNDLSGIARQYSGEYHVTEVAHKIDTDQGYNTHFKVRRTGLTK